MIPCPFDPAIDAAECCGITLTDCCEGEKAVCATGVVFDSAGDPDVVVCLTGHGCATYDPAPDDTPEATRDAWTREDDAVAHA